MSTELDVRHPRRPEGSAASAGLDNRADGWARPPEREARRRTLSTCPRRTLRKQVLDTVSICVWMIATVGRTVGRALATLGLYLARSVQPAGRRVTRRIAAPATPAPVGPEAGLNRKPRGRGLAAVITAVALLAVGSGPVIRLAARPLSRSLSSNGLPPMEVRTTVRAADGTPLAVLHDGVNRSPVPLEAVPEVVRQAVLAAEDKDFWSHRGYDGSAITRALMANLRAREVTQGGSTISQQLAKQNFVGGDQSMVRKGKELLYSVALEERFSKEELLERYLNQVYFGSHAYGIAAAAEEFFGVEANQLSVEQAALLAGLIRAPAALDPRADTAAATARRDQVLRAMVAEGYLPAEAADAAMATPLAVLPSQPSELREPFVVEAVKREFLSNPAFGATEEERRRQLLTGGLEIQTTLDPQLQDAARTATDSISGDLGSALVAINPATGGILALHDGGAAASGHFDVATQGRRAPGSTFKPLAAAAALEAGMPQGQYLVGDGPIELEYRGAPEPWPVNNFDGADHGPVLLKDAVINSVNTAFAQIGVAVGPQRIADVAGRLGVDVEQALGPPHVRGPAIALGGLRNGVSPLELASAYAVFAAGGFHAPPHLITRVMAPDGREVFRAEPKPKPVLDPAVNGILVDMLKDAVAEGTGAAAALPGWEPLGKTGTSEMGADAWFVGAVPRLSAAVWVGHPDGTEPVPGLTGGGVAAPVWGEFMKEALTGVPPARFPLRTAQRATTRPLDLPVARPCGTACEETADR